VARRLMRKADVSVVVAGAGDRHDLRVCSEVKSWAV
jgi:hypothetical protein